MIIKIICASEVFVVNVSVSTNKENNNKALSFMQYRH